MRTETVRLRGIGNRTVVGADGWLAVRAELDRVWDCWIYSVWTTRWVCALDRDVTKYLLKYKKTISVLRII